MLDRSSANGELSPRCTPEQRLVAILCSTRERRQARHEEAAALAAAVDERKLLDLLGRLKLLSLVGQRLVAGFADWLGTATREEIEERTKGSRRVATAMELTALLVLAELERSGIRAMPLKGSTMARALYGDPGMRVSGDVDVLVAPSDLVHATDIVRRMGWERDVHPLRGDALPLLHERLFHPRMPPVEIHWRVHWLEERFAADALTRAMRSSPRDPLRMRPADELASLMLFYARDGFAGLRTPADIAQWWTRESPGLDDPRLLDRVGDRYPELATALELSACLVEELVGVPAPLSRDHREARQLVRKMVNPFTIGSSNQIAANAGLVDVMLAPAGERAGAISRHLSMPSVEEYRRFARFGSSGKVLAQSEHILRVTRRWALGAAAGSAGVYRHGGGLWWRA